MALIHASCHIRSNSVLGWTAAHSETVISLDKRADAGNRASLANLDDDDKRVFVHGDAGHVDKTYNLRGWNEKSQHEVIDRICDELDRKSPRNEGSGYRGQIHFFKDGRCHYHRCAIDATLLECGLDRSQQRP